MMRLSLLLAFLFTSTVALAADRQINQISVEQSDSQTIIRLFGSDLIRSPKDRVFFAAEASSYSVEPTMMYGDSEYVEVALGMPVLAGQYRISIGPNENTSTLESMVVIGAIGPHGPAGRDGADGRDGVDGLDGAPGADGKDGMDGADGLDGAKGDPGVDGADGSSCSVTQTAAGATLSCTDGTMASVANGLNGANGRDGIDGINGINGVDGQDGADGLNGVDGSSCSTAQEGNSVVISCSDGTMAVLAGSGTVVTYPLGDIGPVDVTTFNTGDPVLKDANGILLGKIRTQRGTNPDSWWIEVNVPNETNGTTSRRRVEIVNDAASSQVAVIQPLNGMRIDYETEDCTGQPFANNSTYLHVSPNGGWLAAISDTRIPMVQRSYYQFDRISETGQCYPTGGEFLKTNVSPMYPYTLSSDITNAEYPAFIEILP